MEINIEFKMSSKKFTHERKVYTFLDMLGEIGGFFDAVFYISSFLIGAYTEKHFRESVLETEDSVDLDRKKEANPEKGEELERGLVQSI